MPPDKGLNGLPANELHLIVAWVQPVAGIPHSSQEICGALGCCNVTPSGYVTARMWDMVIIFGLVQFLAQKKDYI